MTHEEMMFAMRQRHDDYCEVLDVHAEEVEGAASWEVFDGPERLFFGAYHQPSTPEARHRPFADVLLLALTFPSIEQPAALHQTAVRFRDAIDYDTVLCEDGAMTQVFWVDPDVGPQYEVWLSERTEEGWKPRPFGDGINPMGVYWEEAHEQLSLALTLDEQVERIAWGMGLMQQMLHTHHMKLNPQAVEGRIHRLPSVLGGSDE